MRTKTYRTASVFCMTLFVTTLIVAEGAGVAWAWRSPPPAYWSGPRLRELPRGYRSVRYGHDSYYFTYGRFYRRGPSGFFLTAPPFGMVVPSLPLGYASLVLGGITYYELNGIYFRQVPEGYRVVEYPVVVEKKCCCAAAGKRKRAAYRGAERAFKCEIRSGTGAGYYYPDQPRKCAQSAGQCSRVVLRGVAGRRTGLGYGKNSRPR